jgi:TRAP-type mannitol/chloroaromatic compound transport system substrate-binding protein
VIDAAEWVWSVRRHEVEPAQYRSLLLLSGWHEPGTTNEFSFNKKAYDALPVDLRRTLDHAAAAVSVYGLTDYHAKNAIALRALKTEFKAKVEIIALHGSGAARLKKIAGDVIEGGVGGKRRMAREIHASYTKYQALVGPWDRVAEGAYHQLVEG